MDRQGVRGLRRQPGYPAFVGAATLARTSDEMFSVGVVLLVLERTGSPGLAGAAIAATTLPSILTAPLFGALLDVSGRRRALMALNQVVIAAALLVLVATIGNAPDWTIPAITLVAGLTYPISFGGFTSLIPWIVPPHLLPPANALETSSFNLALVIGPALAGILAATFGPEWALIVEAGLALAALVLLIPLPDVDGVSSEEPRRFAHVVVDGLRTMVSIRELRGVVGAAGLASIGYGLLTVAFPLYAVDHLGAERTDAGFLWAAFAVGSTLGAVSMVRLQRVFEPWWIVIAGLPVFGALVLLWQLPTSLVGMLLLVGVAAVADGPVLASIFGSYQRVVPEDLRGQVFTTAEGIQVGAFSIGAALAGFAVGALGSAGTLAAVAVFQFAGGAVGWALMRLKP